MFYIMPGERGGVPVLPPGDVDWSGAMQREEPARGSVVGATGEEETLLQRMSRAAELAILAEQKKRPSFCLGLERSLCGPPSNERLFGSFGGPRTWDVCNLMANSVCLILGVFVLLALLALATNALLRS